MNLIEQYNAKLTERESFVASQIELEQKMVKSLRATTEQHLQVIDAGLEALALTIGLVSAPVEQEKSAA